MKLRRIDILGFKSFRTRTGLEIHDGVTSVVGPNGCGKSNIVDAIRWAIGSQSPKDLRGRAMEDVIFAGSENHKPLGFAEVSLTLDNDGRDVPVEYKELSEIKVTRRLFRTGESEYEINGARARLRDIHQLFLGTGVGAKEAYSIIEQGRIGFIVAARPEERRVIIEEAAGITRYKFQRQSAQRRLDKTRENLVRVQDVLSEVERQLASLKRQARRAARGRELAEKKRVLDVRAALDKRDRAAEQRSVVDGRLQAARQSAEITRATLESAEARTEAARAQQQIEEHVHAEATEAVYQARARRDLLQNTLQHQERERNALAERKERLSERMNVEAERVESATAELARTTEAAADAVASAERLEAERAEHADRLAASREQEGSMLRAIDGASAALSDARATAASARARAEAASHERTSLAGRIDAAVTRAAAAASDAETHRTARAAAETAVAEAVAHAGEARAAVELAIARRQEAVDTVDAARRAHREAEHAVETQVARVRSLTGLLGRGEGYASGVRAALDAVARGELRGIGRPVVERLRVGREHEARLAGLLGPYVDALVADDAVAAERFVHWAKGAGVVAAVTWGTPVGGAIADWVSAAEPVPEPVAARLSAHDEGMDLFDGAGPAVDSDATAVRVGPGLVAVGSVKAEAASAARLAADRDAAEAEVERLRADVPELAESAEAAERARADAAAALETASAASSEAQQAVSAAREGLDEANRHASRAERHLEDATGEEMRLRDRLAGLEASSAADLEAAASAESAAAAAEAELAELRAQVQPIRDEVHALADALHDIAARAARSAERSAGLAAATERLRETIRTATEEGTRLEREMSDVTSRALDIADSSGADRAALDASSREADDAESEMARTRARHDAATTAVREAEAGMHAARKAHNEAAAALREVELTAERAANDLEHADAGLVERFQITIAAAREIAGGRPFSDADRAALRDAENALQRLGPVNPAAEEEYAEAQERHDYLRTQKNDLETAMADLEAAVRKMDRTSRELFKTTFDEVDRRFRLLFPRLFEGGRAHLSMTNPEDLLETGIDVVVQPPGKRLQSMTLLSGGEKALTAVALIFSIFQLKPTPFCILDEVDAPLDDANVARFAETVREMSATSQFLLITHNKRTMEVAGTLYGVTMEEPGVSKVVGVRMPSRDEAPAPISAA